MQFSDDGQGRISVFLGGELSCDGIWPNGPLGLSAECCQMFQPPYPQALLAIWLRQNSDRALQSQDFLTHISVQTLCVAPTTEIWLLFCRLILTSQIPFEASICHCLNDNSGFSLILCLWAHIIHVISLLRFPFFLGTPVGFVFHLCLKRNSLFLSVCLFIIYNAKVMQVFYRTVCKHICEHILLTPLGC